MGLVALPRTPGSVVPSVGVNPALAPGLQLTYPIQGLQSLENLPAGQGLGLHPTTDLTGFSSDGITPTSLLGLSGTSCNDSYRLW